MIPYPSHRRSLPKLDVFVTYLLYAWHLQLSRDDLVELRLQRFLSGSGSWGQITPLLGLFPFLVLLSPLL